MQSSWIRGAAALALLAVPYAQGGTLFEGPIWSAEGNFEGERFGWSVSTAGDVNGDGFDDIIIGTWSADIALQSAYVYHGTSAGLSPTVAWQKNVGVNTDFGWDVAAAGDVNGDGYGDVIVGAPKGVPSVYVFHGSPTGLPATANWSDQGPAGSSFGWSVSSAGDVNDDGYDDIVVGAPFEGDAGKAYLYLGSSQGLGTNPVWITSGTPPSYSYGFSVSTAGDVNGDGHDDVLVGESGHDNPTYLGAAEGAVHVFLGSVSGLNFFPQRIIEGDDSFGRLGEAVSSAGDVNDDGYDDVLMGAPDYGQMFQGRAYVHLGSADGVEATAAWAVDGAQNHANFGTSLAGIGDMNGDGRDDIAVGEPGYAQNWGRFRIYYGSPSGVYSWPQCWFNSPNGRARFGERLSSAGNTNSFGYPEILVAGPEMNGVGAEAGGVFQFRSSCGDNDGDGYLDCSACPQVGTCGDCDDEDPTIHTEAPEVNDGIDNQCPGDAGYGVIDEISGTLRFTDPTDNTALSWPAQARAIGYEVARSAWSDLSTGCIVETRLVTFWNDYDVPDPEVCFYYLVRSSMLRTGSWGQDSSGAERTDLCDGY